MVATKAKPEAESNVSPKLTDLRDAVTAMLESKFSSQRSKRFEEKIYVGLGAVAKDYRLHARDLVYLLLETDVDVWADVDEGLMGWESTFYHPIRQAQRATLTKMNEKPKALEGSRKCRKFGCKSTKLLFFQMQTRGGDEGMTTFYTCTLCGTRFKE